MKSSSQVPPDHSECGQVRREKRAGDPRAGDRAESRRAGMQPGGSGNHECGVQAMMYHDPGNDDGNDERAEIASGIDNSHAKRPLAFGQPLGHHLGCGGVGGRFADPQKRAGHAEAKRRSRQRMKHGCRTPCRQCHRVAKARSHAIEPSTGRKLTGGVAQTEGCGDPPVLAFADVVLNLHIVRDQAQHLSIDVVKSRTEEDQRADHPPEISNLRLLG